MRIISGSLGGRRFYPPANKWPTRPTTDIAKEGLFNVLQNRLDFASLSALDLFGGTGAHTYELISRGCDKVQFVDRHKPCYAYVKKMAVEFDIAEQITLHLHDVKKFMKNCVDQFNYIFAGPPYPLSWIDEIPNMVFDNDLLLPDGLFVLETDPHHDFNKHPRLIECRNYGQTHFWFFE